MLRRSPFARSARRQFAGELPLDSVSPAQDPSARRMPGWLFAGAMAGLALAASGLLEPRGGSAPALSDDVAAIVGERVIRRVDYERVLAGVERDRRGPIDDATRRRVLERMIDEELLVQQALALGLAASDRRVRGELVSGLVDSVVAEASGEQPSEAELEAHYRANQDFFVRPGRLRVEALSFDAESAAGTSPPAAQATTVSSARARPDALTRAREARTALERGVSADEVKATLGDPPVAAVPDALLPLAKLRDYLGPAVLEALPMLAVGVWSAPIETGSGYALVRVVESEQASAPALEEVAAVVRQDWIRRRGDDALRRYLDGLRPLQPIVRNEGLFAAP